MPSATHKSVCANCSTSTADFIEVRRRHICHSCFDSYVSTKILKRMESYRFKNQVGDHSPRLLLPISGGVSSLAMLHVLDAQLKRQLEKQRKVAYELVLVHVHLDGQEESVETWSHTLKDRFPGHIFLPVLYLPDVFKYDHTIEQDLQGLGLVRASEEDNIALLTRLFSSTRTATARADLGDLLLQRLLVAVAKVDDCQSILWGHSDSRLAAKALADVAKGRGQAIPNSINDGSSPWNINFNFPVREVYKAELEQYIQLQPKDLMSCVMDDELKPSIAPVATRNTSINALLTGYINSQGEKYPSIMANVVRTAGKLQLPSVNSGPKCKLCAMPVNSTTEPSEFCYGCNRMKQDVKFDS